MKELMDLLGADSATEKVGLGMLLVPLLEKTEGVLEEILEDEAREKASAKKKSKQKRKGRVAQAAPAHAVR